MLAVPTSVEAPRTARLRLPSDRGLCVLWDPIFPLALPIHTCWVPRMEGLWYLGETRCCWAPFPPPPSLSMKFMELGWGWWLCHWCTNYHSISSAVQQQNHRVTAPGENKLYLMWILVSDWLKRGLRRIDIWYIIKGNFFFCLCFFMGFVCVYFLNCSSGRFFSQMKRKAPGRKQSY